MAKTSFDRPLWDTGLGGPGGKSALERLEEIRKKREKQTPKLPAPEPEKQEPKPEPVEAPAITTPTYAAPPTPPPEEQEQEPEKEKDEGFLGLLSGFQYQSPGWLRNLGARMGDMVEAVTPPTLENWQIEQSGPPAPVRDDPSRSSFLGASKPYLASSPLTGAFAAGPLVLSTAVDGLKIGLEQVDRREKEFSPKEAAKEVLKEELDVFARPFKVFYEIAKNYVNSGSFALAQSNRLEGIAQARDWDPEDIEIIPVRERNVVR